tara:strand:- start:277 stop:591 length:315 start_codon:yes stop_codon:yes gene_type:complete
MEKFRNTPPKEIAGEKVSIIEDYKNSIRINLKNQEKKRIDLPKSDVLIFKLKDGSKISLRPSGTEPKIKFYFSVKSKYNTEKLWHEQQKKLDDKINRFINDFMD